MDSTDSQPQCIDSQTKNEQQDILELEKTERENFDNYQTEVVLGEGTYGKVYKVKYVNNQQSYALKIFKPVSQLQQMYEKEVQSLKRVKGYNKFVQIFAQLDQFRQKYKGIVMEFCKGGELLKYIMVNKGLNEDSVRALLHQIVDILETLQQLNLAHLDIKAENFFLNSNFDLILGDFGMCEELQTPNQTLTNYRKGSPSYQIIELYRQMPYKAYDADIFAAGVTMFSMYSCLLPFKQFQSYGILFSNPAQFWTLMRRNSPNPSFQDHLSKDFADLFMRMVHPDPNKRINVQQIREHPFYIGTQNESIPAQVVMSQINNNQNTYTAEQNNSSQTEVLTRGCHSMSINEEFEKFEYQVPNLIKERKAKIYNEQYGKYNDFSTNIDCETLFKFLFIKQEEFSSEIPVISDKSYKLKCIYKHNTQFDKITEEFSHLTIEQDKIDPSISEFLTCANINNNKATEQEEGVLHFNINLQVNPTNSKTYVIFNKKSGDSFEFFKLIASIQELIKTFN